MRMNRKDAAGEHLPCVSLTTTAKEQAKGSFYGTKTRRRQCTCRERHSHTVWLTGFSQAKCFAFPEEGGLLASRDPKLHMAPAGRDCGGTNVGRETPVSQIGVSGSSDWGHKSHGQPGARVSGCNWTSALVPSGHCLEVSKLLFEVLAAENNVFTNKDS